MKKQSLSISLAALSCLTVPAMGQVQVSTYMSGLNNPRGLAFSPTGQLYVAEAGAAGSFQTSFVNPEGNPSYYGTSGSIARRDANGGTERIVTGLPSLGGQNGFQASGPNDLGFNSAGDLFFINGLGTNPNNRGSLPTGGADLGKLGVIRTGTSTATYLADVSAFELNNPDGTTIDSNPYGLLVEANGFKVADAGGNSILNVDSNGNVSLFATLPGQTVPNPFGGPDVFSQAVPTSIIARPGGGYYVGQLTGFPFPQGGASIFSVLPDGSSSIAFGTLTSILDFTTDAQGNLYVLQQNILAGGTGFITRIDTTGARSLYYEGLNSPTSLAFGGDGALYVTNNALAVGGGQVLRIAAVPEPTTTALGLSALAVALRRRRAKRA